MKLYNKFTHCMSINWLSEQLNIGVNYLITNQSPGGDTEKVISIMQFFFSI